MSLRFASHVETTGETFQASPTAADVMIRFSSFVWKQWKEADNGEKMGISGHIAFFGTGFVERVRPNEVISKGFKLL